MGQKWHSRRYQPPSQYRDDGKHCVLLAAFVMGSLTAYAIIERIIRIIV